MFKETDILFMLDIEADGLNQRVNHITSICLQPFTIEQGVCGETMHYAINTNFGGVSRYADKKTLEWRAEHGIDNWESKLPKLSFLEFYEKMCMLIEEQGKENCHIFANHPEFDIGFIKSYIDQCFRIQCWHYQNVWDLGSLLKGIGCDRGMVQTDLKKTERWHAILDLYFESRKQPHNAHYDCVYQIETLRYTWELLEYL